MALTTEAKQETQDTVTTPQPKPKPTSASTTTLCEIIPGTGIGGVDEILDLLDLACGRTAYRHAEGPVVTASFERLALHASVPRGVLIRVAARIIATGHTSLLLRVEAQAEDIKTRRFYPLASAFSTFVFVAGAGASANGAGVAPLSDGSEDDLKVKSALAAARRQYRRPPQVAPAPTPAPAKTEAAVAVLPANELVVTVSKQYLPRHKNFAGMVFGGDLLETTTRVATYAAARVAPSATPRCVGIRYFTFAQPISPLDLWHLTSRAVAVKAGVVYVQVRATIDSKHDGKLSHDALYAVALCGPVNKSLAIDFNGADDETLEAHSRAVLWMEEERIDVEKILSR